jgi:hypothetical protein
MSTIRHSHIGGYEDTCPRKQCCKIQNRCIQLLSEPEKRVLITLLQWKQVSTVNEQRTHILNCKTPYLNMCFKSLLGLKRGVAMQAVENQGSGM